MTRPYKKRIWVKHTEESKQKLREARLWKKNTEEAKLKMKIARVGRKPNLWKKRTDAMKEAHSKWMLENSKSKWKNCHFWRWWITDKNKTIRNSTKYRKWRKVIFDRDNYTCVICWQVWGILNADHIKPFSKFPELRFDFDNWRTLCRKCHRETETYWNRKGLYLTFVR
jgi:hypothetical protein